MSWSQDKQLQRQTKASWALFGGDGSCCFTQKHQETALCPLLTWNTKKMFCTTKCWIDWLWLVWTECSLSHTWNGFLNDYNATTTATTNNNSWSGHVLTQTSFEASWHCLSQFIITFLFFFFFYNFFSNNCGSYMKFSILAYFIGL